MGSTKDEEPQTRPKVPNVVASKTSLKECLLLLRGSTDEHKIAGLLFAAKYILPFLSESSTGTSENTDTSNTDQSSSSFQSKFGVPLANVRRQLLKAMGPVFLRRMFNSKDKEQKTTALNILSMFFEDKRVASLFSDIIPGIVQIVHDSPVTCKEELLILRDCFVCLNSLVSSSPACSFRVLNAAAINALIISISRVIKNITVSSNRKKNPKKEEKSSGDKMNTKSPEKNISENNTLSQEVVTIGSMLLLDVLQRSSFEQFSKGAESPISLFNEVVFIFANVETPMQWTFLAILDTLVKIIPIHLIKHTYKEWAYNLRSGLVQLLRIRGLPIRIRDKSLCLILTLLQKCGQSWILEANLEQKGQFIELWFRLVAIDLKLVLDTLLDPLSEESIAVSVKLWEERKRKTNEKIMKTRAENEEDDEKSNLDGDSINVEQRPMRPVPDGTSAESTVSAVAEPPKLLNALQENRVTTMLPFCFAAMEIVILFLCGEEDNDDENIQENINSDELWTSLPSGAQYNLLKTLNHCAELVFDFISEAAKVFEKRENALETQNGKSSVCKNVFSPTIEHLLVAAIRAIGRWLAEETNSLRGHVNRTMPFLFVWNPKRSKLQDVSKVDPLCFLLPALPALIEDEPMVSDALCTAHATLLPRLTNILVTLTKTRGANCIGAILATTEIAAHISCNTHTGLLNSLSEARKFARNNKEYADQLESSMTMWSSEDIWVVESMTLQLQQLRLASQFNVHDFDSR